MLKAFTSEPGSGCQLEMLSTRRIAILTRQEVAELGAGDWVQASKTVEAIRALGLNVQHLIIKEHDGRSSLSGDLKLVECSDLPGDLDVAHFIPGRLTRLLLEKWLKPLKKRPLLVGSTIFWTSRVHQSVCLRNCLAKRDRYLRSFKAFLRQPIKFGLFKHFDVLLTNSQAEEDVCRKACKLKADVVFGHVPNGIDPIPPWAEECEAPQILQGEEYIIYPGVFATRKNQLGFIRALRHTDYKVVFMGGPLDTPEHNNYYEICRKEAPESWVFMGRIKHGSPEFYGVLRNARVACLASSCETPGIAMLEAASLGVRPAVTREGCAAEYLGFDAEYLDPLNADNIRRAIDRAWRRGRLPRESQNAVRRFTWDAAARQTLSHYHEALEACRDHTRE